MEKVKKVIRIDYDAGAETALDIAEGILSQLGVEYETNAGELPITVTYYVDKD